MTDRRWCDQGCGYPLPPEYADDETTCGACLNETQHNPNTKETTE